MPYPCIDGTSMSSCIVASERAMSGIRRGVFLWQANTSTIDTMSYFVHFNTCIREMNFCHILQYLSWWMGMTATLKKPEILHIEKRTHHCKIGLATSIYWRAASELCGYFDASKWQTRDYIVQLKSSEFRDAGKICPCSTCIQGLFANHWVLARTAHGIEIVEKKASHHYMATWLPEEFKLLFCLLTYLPIDCKFLVSMHLATTCTTLAL